MIRTVIIFLFVAATAVAQGAHTIESSQVYVRDVDTIEVGGIPVRFNGADGPELGTAAGQQGKTFLSQYLRGKTVTCQLTGRKTYDRWVGTCYAGGFDLTALVIAEGYALDCPRYSGGAYTHLETASAKARIGRAGYCR